MGDAGRFEQRTYAEWIDISRGQGANGGGLITGNDLGSVSLHNRSTLSGDLQMGGTFAGGGSFTITGNGTNGIPNGTLFAGTFDGPVTWTLVTLANGTHNYMLKRYSVWNCRRLHRSWCDGAVDN